MQVTDEEKKALLGGAGYFNDYVIKFPSVTITNETIHQESVSIKQAITGDGDLEFGGCIASTFEFEVSEVLTEELKGQEFTTELLVNNGNAARAKMGTYIAETVTQVDDNDYKKVVGYDAFYKMQDDVSDWYNSFFSNITQTTLKNFRQSLLLHFGVESEVQSLPNDNMIVTKTIDTTSNKITGQALLKMTCVLAGGFGIINRDGKFEITYLTSEALYPEENLYPEETLYPEDGEFEYIGLNKDGTEIFYPEYRSVTYEEYNVERISCLILKTNKSSITATIGTDTSNPYIISGNYLLYGKTTEELNTIGNNIVNKFTSVVGYRPCDITTDGMAWLDIGSQIALEKKNDDIDIFMLKCRRVLEYLVNLAGCEGRNPIEDYYKINNELAKYSERLAALPQLIAANKMDITGADEYLYFLREELKDKNVMIFPVSAATVKGFDALLDEIVKVLATLPKTFEYDEEDFDAEVPYEKGFRIEKDGDVFVVIGGSVDYILDTTYAEDEQSMRRFQQYLINEGIIRALRDAGATEDSVVRMGEWEFDFIE